MFSRRTFVIAQSSLSRFARQTHSSSNGMIGFIGLGNMGSKMVKNLAEDGHSVMVYDRSHEAVKAVVDANKDKVTSDTVEKIGEHCSVVFTMLPNDATVEMISTQLLVSHKTHHTHGDKKEKGKDAKKIHVSCSTISPELAKKMTAKHAANNFHFVSSPVFARPDGIGRRDAIWMLSGNADAKAVATKFLKPLGRIEDFGEETGAANVVKLCGNFLIAASIEAIAESMALAEKNGVDRHQVMKLLSTTIFDCLIYKGYGQRVSQRDHKPGGFSLELGYKDVSLVNKAARDVNVPMPFLSTLVDRFLSAKAKGREGFDWSAVGMNVAEDAGIDIKKDLEKNEKAVAAEHHKEHKK